MATKPRILIVDDDARNIRVLRAMLMHGEYEIFEASNGVEALNVVGEEALDLILLDAMMPGLDGFEVLERLKKDPETMFIPVVMVTALSDTESKVRSLESGADDFLVKPVERVELLARVRSLLRVKDNHDRMQNYREELERKVSEKTAKLERYNQRLEMLSWTAQQVNRILEVPVVIRTLISSSMDLLDSSGGAICLFRGNEKEFVGEYCFDGTFREMEPHNNGCPVLSSLAESGEPIIVSNPDNPMALPKFLEGMGAQHLVMIPIGIPEGRIHGGLMVFDEARPFGEVDLDILQNLAASAGIALENAEMLEDVRRSEEMVLASLREKDLLLKEVHHRVKNNLQAISSLFDAYLYQNDNGDQIDVFRKGQNLTRSMALIHEQLYRSTGMETVDFEDYTRTLTGGLLKTFPALESRVSLAVEVKDVHLNMDTAIPLGLIINELVSNAMAHAFPEGRSGQIRVAMGSTGNGSYRLEITDDGVGFPAEFNLGNSQSLGLSLIQTMIGNLNGKMEYELHGGARFTVMFLEYHECGREDL